MSKTKLPKRILAVVLSIMMVIPLITSTALSANAQIGNFEDSSGSPISYGTYQTEDQRIWAYLQNEYISFFICVDSPNKGEAGTLCHTVPTANFDKGNFSTLADFGTQYLRIYKYSDYDMTPNWELKWERFLDKPACYITKGCWYETNDAGDQLTVHCTYDDDALWCTQTFSLQKLSHGLLEKGDEADEVQAEYTDEQNWGVNCHTEFGKESKQLVSVKTAVEYENFTKMGHSRDAANANLYYTEATEYTYHEYHDYQVINGIKSVKQNTVKDGAYTLDCSNYSNNAGAISELFTYSYANANPFVKTFIPDETWNHPELCNITRGTFNTDNGTEYLDSVTTFSPMGGTGIFHSDDGYDIGGMTACDQLWGFRNMVKGTTSSSVTEADQLVFSQDTGYLAIVKDGSSYKVKECATQDEVNNLADVVAAIRGSYTHDYKNKLYRFNGTGAELSPTITATWAEGTENVLVIGEDGSITIDQSKINLNSTTFKFYQPTGGGGLTYDGFDSERGMIFSINAEKNAAQVSVNMPLTKVILEKAYIAKDGNLRFTGKFGLTSLFGDDVFNLEELGYGLKNGTFQFNGIHAKGELKPLMGGDAEKRKILGHGAGKISGEINTFEGQEQYDFDLELEVKDLFKAEASLYLRRLNNGRLCPEKIWIFVNSDVGGIDIPTPAPVVTLTGGGLGIDGLASTINGNYTYIPPVKLNLAVQGKVVKVVDGRLDGSIGATGVSLSASDIALSVPASNSKIRIFDKLSAGLELGGKEFQYKNDTYSGISLNGSFGLGLKIFNIPENHSSSENLMYSLNDVISASADLSLETLVAKNLGQHRTVAKTQKI